MGVAVASAAFAACGDDDKESDSATHEEWFTAACATVGGDQSGFPEFTEAHPDGANLAEWAEFLPTPIAFLDRIIAAAKLPHPAEDDAGMVATIAAVENLQAAWQAAIDAASAEDQAGFDAAMGQAHSDFQAMEAAMDAVDPRECPGFGE
jgi:hypothetical protein